MYQKKSRVHIDIWGDYAVFTQPHFKIERYSYDVITPSASRNILQQIYWHPSFQYEIERITVYNPFQRISITRNEFDTVTSSPSLLSALKKVEECGTAPSLHIPASAARQQRSTTMLRDVHYGIDAIIRPSSSDYNPNGEIFNLKKIVAIFKRRLSKGQCFRQPYLGIREYPAHFASSRYNTPYKPVHKGTVKLGTMFFDSDYSNCDNVRPYFFSAVMVDGVLDIPTQKEVMHHAAFCTY